jgi:hypothetical protein
MEVQPRPRAAIEEPPEKGEGLGQRAQVADDDPKLALLAHGELRRMAVQALQLLQEHARALVKGLPGFGQRNAIAAAVQETEPQLGLEILDRRRDRRLRAQQLVGGGLEAAFADDRVEAEQLLDRHAGIDRVHR